MTAAPVRCTAPHPDLPADAARAAAHFLVERFGSTAVTNELFAAADRIAALLPPRD